MDNVTHSLIGFLMSRSPALPGAKAPKAESAAAYRRAALWTCVLGNNLPDGDFLIAKLAGGGNLNYLLHHRGHTHTLAFAPFAAVIAAWVGARMGRLKLSENRGLLVLGLLSACMHLAADSWNDYGIHPFWPIVNRWFYGDFIFIMEPLLWFSLLPLVIFEAETKVGRAVAVTLGALMLGAAWFVRDVPWMVAGWLTLWALAVAAAQRKVRGPLPATLSGLVVLATFAAAGAHARSLVREQYARDLPHEAIHQLESAPAPGNPFCWRTTVASVAEDGRYFGRVGGISLLPSVFDPSTCNPRIMAERTAPMEYSPLPSSRELIWVGAYVGSVASLEALSAINCRVAAIRRFARIPFVTNDVAGDLRYDLEKGLGFAEIHTQLSLGCPRWIPPWVPPFP